MRDSQRLLRTIRCKRRRTVGANCVRPFLICCELADNRISASLYKGAFDGRASPFLRYTIHAKQKGFLIKGSLCNFQNNAIEIKSDYINYNTYLIPRRTWDIS